MKEKPTSAPTLRILEARFDLPLTHEQIPAWRGAFAAWGGIEHDIFHNHNNNGTGKPLHYRYPLVQYRSVRGRAAIFAVNEGIEAIVGLLQRPEWSIHWEGRPHPIRMEQMQMDTRALGLGGPMQHYRLRRWLGLNEENYAEWQRLPTFQERVALLDKVLAANLLSLCSGLHWRLPRRFEAWIVQIDHIGHATVHDTEMMVFDLHFCTDLVLPPGLAMGKSASLGFGVVLPMRGASDSIRLK